jgi:ketosteroid isomerase-like protein
MTMTKTICCLTTLAFSAPAFAADKAPAAAPAAAAPAPAAAPAAMPDMSKIGPMSRPVTKPDKKGVDELYAAFKDAMTKGDVNAAADLVDFPIIMLSDDSKGVAKHFNATREQWVGIMAPFITNMPKDMKMFSKHNAQFLSDTLAVSIEDNGMSMGKVKGKWKSLSMLTLKDGKWKFKEMSEAGWGDMAPPLAPTTAMAPAKPTAQTPPTKK